MALRFASLSAPLFAAIAAAAAVGGVVWSRSDNHQLRQELSTIRQEVQATRAMVSKIGPGAPQRPRPNQPDPSKVYAVGVDGEPATGKPDALLTVVLAYEYACPWCNKQRPVLDEIQKTYGDDVRIVFRPFIVHPDVATDASLAACAAHRDGKFAAIDEALWRDAFGKRAFDRASIEAIAVAAGVDKGKLAGAMDACKADLAREQDALRTLGVTGTPMVWVNGRPASGFRDLAKLKPLLDEELARARERVAAGTPRDRYYAEWVMKKGLTKVEPSGT